MKQEVFQILTAADLAQIVLGWVIILVAIILVMSEKRK